MRGAAAAFAIAGLLAAVGASAQTSQRPAEEQRLSNEDFHEGLKKRGLTELLELHLQEFPPSDAVSRLQLEREILLAESNDQTRPDDERIAAIAQANERLKQLIEANPQDPRRFEWTLKLVRSMLYEQGEKYISGILFRGGSERDLSRLRKITARAVTQLETLQQELSRELERIDNLSVPEFEKLERTGYIEQIDTVAPQAKYLLLWANFYDAIARSDDDPEQAMRFRFVLEMVRDNPSLLDTSRDVSAPQVSLLMMVGAAHRHLQDHTAAEQMLEKAIRAADRLTGKAELQEAKWAVIVAWLERARNRRDKGDFDTALTILNSFRSESVKASLGDPLELQFLAALVEQSIYEARAERARASGAEAETRRYERLAWDALARLLGRSPDDRDRLYSMIYALLDDASDVSSLNPVEQAAMMAGLLRDAARAQGPGHERGTPAAELLDRAIGAGEAFLANPPEGAANLTAEVTYNTAVATYQRGFAAQAARSFLTVASEHPGYEHAQQAATLAIQISSRSSENPSVADGSALYLEALKLLTSQFPASEAARYWRFYFGQALESASEFDRAAVQFALVDHDHEHFVESRFLQLRSLAQGLQRRATEQPDDLVELRRRTIELVDVQRELNGLLQTRMSRLEEDAARKAQLRSMMAESLVIVAEAQVLPQVGDFNQALRSLERFEEQYDDSRELVGRVLRVRILCYDRLGMVDKATQAIPAYVASDPAGAGPTLQTLYETLARSARELHLAGNHDEASSKARIALQLAQQVSQWANEHAPDLSESDRNALEVQLASAHLEAGDYEVARERFAALRTELNIDKESEHPLAPPLNLGLAQALYGTGDCREALPLFNHLAVTLQPDQRERWLALLRDLQCRDALGEPPETILRVLRQQETLFPRMGGPEFRPEFAKLRRRCEARVDG